MFHLLKIVHRPTALNEQCDLVDTLVHPVIAYTLCAVELAAHRVEREFYREWQRVGIVACVRSRVGRGTGIGNAELLEAFGCQPGRGHRHIEYLGDRGSDRPLVPDRVTEHHVVGHDTTLTISRIGQVIEPRLARQRVRKFDGVAHGIDIGRRGLQIIVHPDAARLADSEPGRFCQRSFGTHTDRQDNDVSHDTFPAFEEYLYFAALLFEPLDTLLQIETHTLLQQVLVHV